MTSPFRGQPLTLDADQFETVDGLIARRVPSGTSLFRLHRTANGAIYFRGADPGLRFNDPGPGAAHPLAPPVLPSAAPDSGSYGVCYFGRSPDAAFVEVFFRRLPNVSVAWSELAARTLTEVVLTRDLTLICLVGPGLLRLGVAADIVAGRDYTPAQVTERGLWRNAANFDGIEYPTRHDPDQRSIALFGRALSAVPSSAIARSAILDPTSQLVSDWIRRYRFPIIDDR